MWHRVWHSSIKNRLTFLFFCITAGAIGVFYFYVVPQLESTLTQQKLDALKRDSSASTGILNRAIEREVTARELEDLPQEMQDVAEQMHDAFSLGFRPTDDLRWSLDFDPDDGYRAMGTPWADDIADVSAYRPKHAMLYNVAGQLGDAGSVDITSAAVRRPGRDVSVITYGGSLGKALEAADQLAADGLEAEVVDLRSLRPLDDATILDSVRRTHRAVVVDEGWRSGSLSAEVAARIGENAFFDLDAVVERVCSAEVPMPYAKQLEDAALPQVGDVVAAVRRVVAVDG